MKMTIEEKPTNIFPILMIGRESRQLFLIHDIGDEFMKGINLENGEYSNEWVGLERFHGKITLEND